jgi:NADH:ubiquinone reductase (H+-translocating)
MMATIGRTKAVVSTGSFQLSGFMAWLVWVFVHIVYLMKFRNRVFVLLQWSWSYFTFGRGARLITHRSWRFYSGEKIKMD